ncbi:MAG: DUF5686 and carboxypeptidase regulatory-like domain-containing protein [Muribaculaceae bacterium]|nr:DUF5686 and carboxypeptidase regulatory-like domain-containing protein [Muribaculaceae bacterium]
MARGVDGYFIRGIVRDSITDEPLPYASVIIGDAGRGTVADDDGVFEFTMPADASSFQVSYMGYDKKTVPVKRGRLNMYAVYLSPSATDLKEVVVHRSKYSKKNNPAIAFLEKLKVKSREADPMNRPFYSFDKYEKINLGLNDFTIEDKNFVASKFPFLTEYVDTSEVSGKPYLTLLVKEKASEVFHRNDPEKYQEIIEGMRSAGVDEMLDADATRTMFEDIMREVNLEDNDINLMQNRFVSPLGRLAPDFYKFYLTDTVAVGDEQCAVLSFYPHNRASFGFIGHIYVPVNDPKMPVRKVDMHVPKEINLNYVDNLYITQTYTDAPDGARLKNSDDMTVELSIAGKGKIYASRRTALRNHSFDSIPDTIFVARTRPLTESLERDSAFWEKARTIKVGKGDRELEQLMARLRKVPLYYWSEKVLKLAFTGYVNTSKMSRFDVGPLNSTLSFNNLEKLRLRIGGMTTANLSRHWFGRFYVAYGFWDHRWKYMGEAEYSFIPKQYHSREFPVRALRFTTSYDFEHPGENYMFTSPDNIVLSLKRKRDDRATYRRTNSLAFIWETASHFAAHLTVENIHRTSAHTMPLVTGEGMALHCLNTNAASIMLRYAPGEKFFQTRSYRIPVNIDAPAVTLRHTFAPSGCIGNRYGINRTEAEITKRWWFSAFGYLDTFAGGGHVWGRTSFLDLYTPEVNLSYIIQPGSFALMNPMEFVSSSWAWWDFTYWANGALLNYIPYVKKLKLREVFGFRGYWGDLNRDNDPAAHPELLQLPDGTDAIRLDHGPYMEASVGLDNILTFLRIDYVWRVNYRKPPYPVDHSGVRIAMHFTF